MKEKNNGLRICVVAATVVALGLLALCIALQAANDDLEKQVLVLKSQVRKFRAGSIAIPIDDREWDPEKLYVYGKRGK